MDSLKKYYAFYPSLPDNSEHPGFFAFAPDARTAAMIVAHISCFDVFDIYEMGEPDLTTTVKNLEIDGLTFPTATYFEGPMTAERMRGPKKGQVDVGCYGFWVVEAGTNV